MNSTTVITATFCCRTLLAVALFASALVPAAGCGGGTQPGGQQSEPTGAKDNEQATVNLDEIFPPGPGRDLVLNNCQSCHVWVPIVILQMDKTAWSRNSLEHRDRVKGLSDDEFKILYDYLSSTFTPDRPVPKLPPSLLSAWTSY